MGKKNKKKAVELEKDKMHINPMDLYNRPRQPGDLDLITIIRVNIDALANGNDEHGKAFLRIPDIKYHIKANPVAQRLVINRVLVNKLLVWRSENDKTINNVLPFIANDGYLEDWVTLLKEIVLPFCVENSVFIEKPKDNKE